MIKKILSEWRIAEEIFKNINNEDLSKEDGKVENNVTAIVSFSAVSAT